METLSLIADSFPFPARVKLINQPLCVPGFLRTGNDALGKNNKRSQGASQERQNIEIYVHPDHHPV